MVSIARIKNGNVAGAVSHAIELLGGIGEVIGDKGSIMLKPNLVGDAPDCTTNPEVIYALARLLQDAGKEVAIGEGSAVASGFGDGSCYIKQSDTELDAMQKCVFDNLGYSDLAKSLGVHLFNLHTGPMETVNVPNGLTYKQLTIRRELTKIGLLCSVPMMKVHRISSVSLGMKNLIGLYPGKVYGSLRAKVHEHAFNQSHPSPGVAFEIIDMVRVNKLGLTVIDGSRAMVGDGPCGGTGTLVPMNLIIAGINPLATDMVAASIMRFEPDEIDHFVWAYFAGMGPRTMDEIEVRGETLFDVGQPLDPFAQAGTLKPNMITWQNDMETNQYHECPEQSVGRCPTRFSPYLNFPHIKSP